MNDTLWKVENICSQFGFECCIFVVVGIFVSNGKRIILQSKNKNEYYKWNEMWVENVNRIAIYFGEMLIIPKIDGNWIFCFLSISQWSNIKQPENIKWQNR